MACWSMAWKSAGPGEQEQPQEIGHQHRTNTPLPRPGQVSSAVLFFRCKKMKTYPLRHRADPLPAAARRPGQRCRPGRRPRAGRPSGSRTPRGRLAETATPTEKETKDKKKHKRTKPTGGMHRKRGEPQVEFQEPQTGGRTRWESPAAMRRVPTIQNVVKPIHVGGDAVQLGSTGPGDGGFEDLVAGIGTHTLAGATDHANMKHTSPKLSQRKATNS